MTRRRRPPPSSLELLLDTICNTFGGILFVAILVIVMLQKTSKTAATGAANGGSELEMLRLERERTEVQGGLDAYRRAADQLPSQSNLSDPEANDLYNHLKQVQRERQSLSDAKSAAVGRIARRQESINKSASDLAKLNDAVATMEKGRKDAAGNLAKEIKSRTKSVELPRSHRSEKREVQTAMRYGRFYVWHNYDQFGLSEGLNTDDYVVIDETPAAVVTTPKPYGGIPVDKTAESHEKLASRLDRFNPTKQYVAITVWPDSFPQFADLKEVLVRKGFQYRLIPATADSQFVDRGGSSDGVQ